MSQSYDGTWDPIAHPIEPGSRALYEAHLRPYTDWPTTAYETLPNGGRQSVEPERYDLIPPESLKALAQVHAEGAAKHGEGNWRLIPVNRHLGRALGHIVNYFMGDRSEPHLAHALCRINMAYALSMEETQGC